MRSTADADAVRHLLAQRFERLFPHHFRADDALGLVGYHIVREILRALRHRRKQRRLERVEPLARFGGAAEHRAKQPAPAQRRARLLRRALRRGVALVDQRKQRRLHAREALQDALVPLAHALLRVGYEQHGLHVAQRLRGDLLHVFAQAVFRRGHAGRIQKYDLAALAREHAEDAVARGLRPVGHDGDLLPHKTVEQRALACVGAADERDEAGAVAPAHVRFLPPNACGSSAPSVVSSASPAAPHTATGICGSQNSESACRHTPHG